MSNCVYFINSTSFIIEYNLKCTPNPGQKQERGTFQNLIGNFYFFIILYPRASNTSYALISKVKSYL